MRHSILSTLFLVLLPLSLLAQIPKRQVPPQGHFLTDSIEIGRPFQYALTYQHPAINDVLFPDTARFFTPYRVQQVAVFATQTTGTGLNAISRDSAVYTLVSFETNVVQRLRVPILLIHDVDCTTQWTQIDSVFLRSKLPKALRDSVLSNQAITPQTASDATRLNLNQMPAPLLATETDLVPLRQQFNYWALAMGLLFTGFAILVLYALFGRAIQQRWQLLQLDRRHTRFLREYARLTRRLNSYTAAETANQAVIMWKTYLEKIDLQPYTSLTTPELAARMNDKRVANALREADRMIYGGTFSPESLPALRLLGEVATKTYHQVRLSLQRTSDRVFFTKESSVDTPSAP